jgi:hypothetical protein
MADSRASEQQIKILLDQLTAFFPKHCSMHIRKYIVNDLDTMLAIPSEDRIAALQDDNVLCTVFAGPQEPPSLKILGIAWNYVKDEMYFDFTTLMAPRMLLEKMELLRILHSLYNPMGVLIPFTITGILALQMCSRQGLTWKAKLPGDIKEAWDPWMSQVQELNGYSFIRTIIPGEQPNKTKKQIHLFADASKDAYAAVAYMRCKSNGKVTVRFIQAKSRVRPV